MLLATIAAGWLFLTFGNHLLRLPSADPTAVYETLLQSQKAGLPMPRVYEADSSSVFAQSRGPHPYDASIVLSSRILGIPPKERGAVIAHELAHLGNWDLLFMTVLGTVVALLEIIAITADTGKWFVGAVLVLLIVANWEREFRADSVGARNSGLPMELANALRRMRSIASLTMLPLFVLFAFLLFLTATFPQEGDRLLILLVALGLGFYFPTHPPIFLRTWWLKGLAQRQVSS